jgi:hypothetical protein
MNLRAIILLGWKNPANGIGQPVVENLYTGFDGAELVAKHAAAQKTGGYIAFRKIINPSGIPMPMVVDPLPKPPVFPRPEIPKHEPALHKKLQESQTRQQSEMALADEKRASEKKLADEKRASEKKLADEKQAAADKLLAAQNAFDELNALTKVELASNIAEINAGLPVEKQYVVKPEIKKIELVNFILTSRGITPPADETETE